MLLLRLRMPLDELKMLPTCFENAFRRVENASHVLRMLFHRIENASRVLRMLFRRIENASYALRMLFEELKMLPTF